MGERIPRYQSIGSPFPSQFWPEPWNPSVSTALLLSACFDAVAADARLEECCLGAVCVCASVDFGKMLRGSGAFGVQHLDEQVVAGHVSAQVLGTQVLLGLGAQGANLGQPQHQLTEPVHVLRVRGERVFQQRAVHLLLHALH